MKFNNADSGARSHVSYYNGSHYDTGVCPSTLPKHIIALSYKIVFK